MSEQKEILAVHFTLSSETKNMYVYNLNPPEKQLEEGELFFPKKLYLNKELFKDAILFKNISLTVSLQGD